MNKMDAECVICTRFIGDKSKASVLRLKGCEGLNEAAKQRNEQIKASAGDYVHKECRKNYTNPKIIKHDLREGDSDVPLQEDVVRQVHSSPLQKIVSSVDDLQSLTVRRKAMTSIQFGHSVCKKRYQKFVRKEEMTGPTRLKEIRMLSRSSCL